MSSRQLIMRLLPWRWIAIVALWGAATWIWLERFLRLIKHPAHDWLFDWHVYLVAARDFLARDLYITPLVYAHPLPVRAFNYPPGSAVMAVPFLVFPDDVGGLLWVILNIASVAAVAVLTMIIVGARPVWLWSGLLFFAYTFLSEWSLPAYLGNNTPLVLLFVAGAVTAHISNRSTLAGVLLGVAIAMKLWPAALAVPLARERSWHVLGWAFGTAAVIIGGGLIWLGGFDVVGPMVRSMLIDIEPGSYQVLLGLTWLRMHTDWWPVWGGYVVAVLLLLIPVKGRLGYGVAIFAGLAAIPNLWRHYISTVVFAAALVIDGLRRRRQERASAPEGEEPAEPMPRLDDAATQP